MVRGAELLVVSQLWLDQRSFPHKQGVAPKMQPSSGPSSGWVAYPKLACSCWALRIAVTCNVQGLLVGTGLILSDEGGVRLALLLEVSCMWLAVDQPAILARNA